MNVEYLNPFIEASRNVFKQAVGFDMSIGKLNVKPQAYSVSGVLIVVGIVGIIKGKAMLFINKDFACRIASAMMMGMPVNDLDEISKSALAELSNMILGNTATIFYKKGLQIDITPPSVIQGDNIEVTSSKQQNVGIPLVCEQGQMELLISFVEA